MVVRVLVGVLVGTQVLTVASALSRSDVDRTLLAIEAPFTIAFAAAVLGWAVLTRLLLPQTLGDKVLQVGVGILTGWVAPMILAAVAG